MWTEINFVLGKNGGHTPSNLGGRLNVVVRLAGIQAGWLQLAVYKIFKIQQLQWLFEWSYGANNFIPIDKWPVFERNIS